MLARRLRITAVVLVGLGGVLVSLFVVGETFADPGGWQAAGLCAIWLVPMVALVVVALRLPDLAVLLLPALAMVATGFVLVDAFWHLVPRDVGPVDALTVFVLAVPIGLTGLRRPLLAGGLLVWLGVVLLVTSGITRHGLPLGAVLGGSSGALVLPQLLIGGLLLLAGWLDHTDDRSDRMHHPPAGTRTG